MLRREFLSTTPFLTTLLYATDEFPKAKRFILEHAQEYVNPGFEKRLETVLNEAIDFIHQRAGDSAISIEGNVLKRKLVAYGSSINVAVPIFRYLQDVAYGFIGTQVHQPRKQKLPTLLKWHATRADKSLDNVVALLERKLSTSNPNSLMERLSHSFNIINLIATNEHYAFEDNPGFLTRIERTFSNLETTPYVKPLADESVDYMKSPTQFFIDGGGDCDDYTAAALFLHDRLGLPALNVNVQYTMKELLRTDILDHAVLGLEIPQQERALLQKSGYKKQFANLLWQEDRPKFEGTNWTIYKYADYALPSTSMLRVKHGCDERDILLIEPQQTSVWKGYGIPDNSSSVRFSNIIEPRTGKRFDESAQTWWAREMFEIVRVHRDGRVDLVTQQNPERGNYFDVGK